MFFRGCRILWRLFRSLPKAVQLLLVGAFLVVWALTIMAVYGQAHTDQRTTSADARSSASAAPSGSSGSAEGDSSVTAAPATPAVPPTASSPYHRVPGLARGCLGGVDPTQAVFTAQQQAPLTPEGAAEVALSYVRWGARYPHLGNPTTQGAQLWAPNATSIVKQAGQWPAGMPETSIYASTLKSHFKVEDFSSTAATVALDYAVVSTTNTGTTTEDQATEFHLVVVDGHWRIQDAPKATLSPDELDADGQPYAGGC